MIGKKKPERPHKRAASIDGFVTDGRRLGTPLNRSYQPDHRAEIPTLDNFSRRADGFRPMRQSPGGLGGTAVEAAERDAVLDEPIVLDDLDYDKRKDRVRGK